MVIAKIFVQRINDSDGGNDDLHPISLGRAFSRKYNKAICVVRRSGAGKLAVFLKSAKEANKLLDNRSFFIKQWPFGFRPTKLHLEPRGHPRCSPRCIGPRIVGKFGSPGLPTWQNFCHECQEAKQAMCWLGGLADHKEENLCPNENSPSKCANCGRPHLPNSKDCPKFGFQNVLRAYATRNRVTFAEAKSFLSPSKNQKNKYPPNQLLRLTNLCRSINKSSQPCDT